MIDRLLLGIAMRLTRLTSCLAKSGLFTVISTVIFASAAAYFSLDPADLGAQDTKETDSKVEEADPDYVVPDGTPDEIMEFLDKLKARKTKFANRHEKIDHAIKLHRAMINAGDQILGQHADAKTAANAAKMKLNSLTVLAANGIGDGAKEAMVAVTNLRADKRPEVSKVANQFWTTIRILNVSTLDPAGRKKLTNEILTSVADSKFSQESSSLATLLAENLSSKGHVDEAGEVYDGLSKLAKDADDPEIRSSASQFEGIARRTRLPGHFLALEGKTLNGAELDWASYRGKVVLVDFWATWCGPCVQELPNVLKNYKKYHDKGFDVVGISLDRSSKPLERFIQKNEIPWTQLYDAEIQKGEGWNHPIARHFGISAIPATILVDQEGNVVSLQARGAELTVLLEKLLGNPK